MNRNVLWRGILILSILAIAVFVTVPPKEKINLGLDLKGGMNLMLQVKTEDAVRAETDSDMERILQIAKEEEVAGAQGRRTGDSTSQTNPRSRPSSATTRVRGSPITPPSAPPMRAPIGIALPATTRIVALTRPRSRSGTRACRTLTAPT